MEIHPDLSDILDKFCTFDHELREKYLLYAKNLIEKHSVIVYKGVEYRMIDDLQVDLEAECREGAQ